MPSTITLAHVLGRGVLVGVTHPWRWADDYLTSRTRRERHADLASGEETMSLPKTLDMLTGASWKAAKKQAGVKGAGFFDSSSGKAVAAKIDDYQDKAAAFSAKKDSSSADALVKATKTLMIALSAAKKDRTFTDAVAKEFESGIQHLIKELSSAASATTLKANALAELSKVSKIEDVLKSPMLKSRFRSFLKQRHAEESLDFLEAILQKKNSQYIMNKFVKEDADQQINLSSNEREAAERGDFTLAARGILLMLRDDQMKPFIQHEIKHIV